MLLKEFLDNINSADDEFTMSAIVDENSNSDAPNAKYVLKKGDNVIGTYDNSVRAKEGYEAAKALVGTPVAEVVEPELVEDTNNEVVSDGDNEVIEEPEVFEEVVEETVEEQPVEEQPVEETTEVLPNEE